MHATVNIFSYLFIYFCSFYLTTTVLPPTILISKYDGLIGTKGHHMMISICKLKRDIC